jgi:hypothetical protein
MDGLLMVLIESVSGENGSPAEGVCWETGWIAE